MSATNRPSSAHAPGAGMRKPTYAELEQQLAQLRLADQILAQKNMQLAGDMVNALNLMAMQAASGDANARQWVSQYLDVHERLRASLHGIHVAKG